MIDMAGLSLRGLEELTSSARSASEEGFFYSKSQWGRWLNGKSRPPWKAIKKLSEKLSPSGIDAAHVLDLWGQAFTMIPPPRAAEGSPARPRQLPASVVHFTGREAELEALSQLAEDAADAGGTVVIMAIGGTAGVGKTALAVHWAHQVAGRFPGGQLYVNLRGYDPSGVPVTPAEAIREFLDALAVPADRIPTGADAQAGLYRTLLAGKRMLIVLDNAHDAAQVRPLLPGAPGCLVLITSRSQLTGLAAAEGARPIRLDVLTDDEARGLLARRLGARRVAAEPEAVTELVRLCARLPLALNIAAARAAAQPTYTLAMLAAGLRDERSRLDALDTGEPASSVRALFSWSFQSLSDPAARMFRLLGLHAGPDISIAAAASLGGLPPAQVRSLIAELADAHLIAEHVPGRYAFHDLLRAYAADLGTEIDGDAERRDAVSRVLDHYLQTAYSGSQLLNPARPHVAVEPHAGVAPETFASPSEALAWFGAERQALMAAISQASEMGFDTHAWQLPGSLTLFFDRQGHWRDLVAIQHTAIAAATRLGDLVGQAHSYRDLGVACGRLGSLDEGRMYCCRALDLYRELGDWLGEARTQNDIAILDEQQGRLADALAHAKESLALFREEGYEPGLAKMLNGVGWLLAQLGDYEQALQYCEQALGMYRERGDPLNEAATWDSFGYVLFHLGRTDEAIKSLRTALSIIEGRRLGYYQTSMLVHLGDAYHAASEPALAHQAWGEALAILDELKHPDAEQVRAKLAPLQEDP